MEQEKLKKKTKTKMAKEILTGILNYVAEIEQDFKEMRRYANVYIDYSQINDFSNKFDSRKLQKELSRLKKEKFIKERKIGERLQWCLTDKGEKAAIKHQVLKIKKTLKNGYYIVIFDIPESERATRSFFRLFLKDAGFVRLQQSVWVTQKEILKPLMEMIHISKAEEWIKVITATKISDFSPKIKNNSHK